jgi:hypothetical protein
VEQANIGVTLTRLILIAITLIKLVLATLTTLTTLTTLITLIIITVILQCGKVTVSTWAWEVENKIRSTEL